MEYFLTHKLYAPISAIEKMMRDRVRLFREQQREAVFVTRDYQRSIAPLLKKYQLDRTEYLNMFDFFQGFADREAPVKTIKPEIAHDHQSLSADGLQETFSQQGQTVAIIRYRSVDHTIDTISYYDPTGKVISIDLYDSRGWLSMTQLLDNEGRVTTQLFWNAHHELVYTEQYAVLANGQWGNRSMHLQYHGAHHFFVSMEQLFAYFLDAVAQQDPEASFYADRHETAVESLCEMTQPAKKYLVMHSSHLVASGQLTLWVQKAVSAKFTGILVSTPKQAHDLQKLVNLPVFVVPVRYLTDDERRRPYTINTSHRLLVVARLSAEKRVGDAIQAVNVIRQSYPDAMLDIYGAPMAGYIEQKHLVKLVADLGLKQAVSFQGFKDRLDDIYPGHSAMLVTSEVEGFNVSILEAQSYGLPVVTYDIDYGPTTLVINQHNGIVVDINTPAAMAQAVVGLWRNPVQLESLSREAYQSTSRYSKSTVWRAWQAVLNHR